MCIRQRRQAMKMTQGELGDSMGVTCSCVNNWEQEVALPKTRQLPLLAAVLDCSIDELFLPYDNILPPEGGVIHDAV